ncbi:MAG: cytochrome c peroxidase [Archangium sp.]|nr:cytochrome c peroxidase [Archangium sp.]
MACGGNDGATGPGVGTRREAAMGDVSQTPETPMELPVEVEIELSPAGSLKQALLWKELLELLEEPGAVDCPADDPGTPFENESYFCRATIERRPSFTATPLPPINIYSPAYNFLTGQPLRLRTSDGEVSWDQPGPLFSTDESCLDPGSLSCDAFNTPIALRTVIGHLVACPDDGAYQAADVPAAFCTGKPEGSLVVFNPTANGQVPPDGTVVAVSAYVDGQLVDEAGEPVAEFEAPVNEADFLRDDDDLVGVPNSVGALRQFIGRPAAEVLGKALFWDMQVGSDGVQSCGTCHFAAGVDTRTRNQLNPNTTQLPLPDGDLEVSSVAGSATTNVEVVATDFPFHKRINPDAVGDGTDPSIVVSDADDVMSSMGVSRFKNFVNIPQIGFESFIRRPVHGVRALRPDLGSQPDSDPVELMTGVRRIEPRNTPTFHGAAFNFDNFWDGRARFVFNGGSVFGAADPTAHIFINPGLATRGPGAFGGATMGHLRPELLEPDSDDFDPELAAQPVRVKFSSLASQALGPPLSDFEMSFLGRNWAKIGKKLLQGDDGAIQQQGTGAPQQAGTSRQNAVVPLANQLVATDDSVLGPFSNQGGSICEELGRPTVVGKPGLCISYSDLVRLAFAREYWNRNNRHLNGAPCADPFDSYCLTVANGKANPINRNQFTQMEANFSLFFALAVQTYEELTIPDDTPVDVLFDTNPNAGYAVGEPGDQAVLFPTLITDLLDDGRLNGTSAGAVTLVPGVGPDELFGFDLFSGANLTAGLRPEDAVDPVSGRNRNPLVTNSLGQEIRVGSNPFNRSAKCMLCHLGPEQTDHSINISHGLLKNDAEFEYPTPPAVVDPTTPPTFPPETSGPFAGLSVLPSPEPSGSSRSVPGFILAEEVGEGMAQDAVEVEPRNFATLDDPATPWDDRVVSQPGHFAFGDQGIYNVGLRPVFEDLGRGGDDVFGWPLSLSALVLKNIAGQDFEPCDGPLDSCVMPGFDPFDLGASFEETGGGAVYPNTTHTLQSINPGYERDPLEPQMPMYLRFWVHSLPAGELHPQIDEMAGMVPNTITPPNGGPGIEFPEILFGADFHCALYDPAQFGLGPPNFGWGPPTSDPASPARSCPQNQSGVAGNHAFPAQGTWPVPNRVLRDGAFKAPPLRNVELTGPYFHTGSYLTLRQVVDFYMRGGDFPVSNAQNRDPQVVAVDEHAFGFGRTTGADLLAPLNHVFSVQPPFTLVGTFADGLPDTAYLYDRYPDMDHPITPEPAFASREAALEDAKNSIVKFLIALTDRRVKYEQAPFDHPEIFVPIDGAAPENVAGRGTAPNGAPTLVSLSGTPCPVPGPGSTPTTPCFRQVPAVGAGGRATPLPGFLGVTTIPPGRPGYTCSQSAGPVSHFCRVITP